MLNIELRNPEDVMKLSRLGSFHQSKLSFLRSFIREFKNWEFNRDIFDLDKSGYGCLLYTSPSPRDISGSRMPSSA